VPAAFLPSQGDHDPAGGATVSDVQLAESIIGQLRARGGYDERGYVFLLAAVDFLQGRLDVRRHVTGAELAWACRDLALDRFGKLAPAVLGHWGITRTEDFGRIVFHLVEVGLLVTQPGDSEADFTGVYDFAEAFGGPYIWQGVPAR
jgi:uncharacterized repeat protein (TIGR04138 family)